MQKFPPVLVPENCRSSYGLPAVTNSSECIICGTDLSNSTNSIITHPSCRTSFCASCLLQWYHSAKRVTCPTCRGDLGADLTTPGYDPGNKEFYLASEGVNELRQIVGDELFLRAPRIERFVRKRLLTQICAEIAPTNVHLAMANQPRVLDELLSPTGRDLPIAPLERAAFISARRTLRDWIFNHGVTSAAEYCFLDGDGDVRYYVPCLPRVRVFASKDELVDHICAREPYVSEKERIGDGMWLKMVLSSQLKKMLDPKDLAGLAIVNSANDHSNVARRYPTRWALYSPGDSMDNTLFVAPLKVFRVPYFGDGGTWSKYALVRTFTTRRDNPLIPPESTDPDVERTPDRHRALHDYEDEFPLVDERGITLIIPPGLVDHA